MKTFEMETGTGLLVWAIVCLCILMAAFFYMVAWAENDEKNN